VKTGTDDRDDVGRQSEPGDGLDDSLTDHGLLIALLLRCWSLRTAWKEEVDHDGKEDGADDWMGIDRSSAWERCWMVGGSVVVVLVAVASSLFLSVLLLCSARFS